MAEAAAVAGGSSLLAIGLSAYGTVTKAEGVKAADEFQAQKAEEAAKFGRLQADLTDVTMREKLNTTLGNIDAIRAAAKVDPTSPTTVGVEDWQRTISERQRLAAVGTQRAQAASDDASAKYLRSAGEFALQQGYLGAAAGIAGGVAQGYRLGGGGGGGGGGAGAP